MTNGKRYYHKKNIKQKLNTKIFTESKIVGINYGMADVLWKIIFEGTMI